MKPLGSLSQRRNPAFMFSLSVRGCRLERAKGGMWLLGGHIDTLFVLSYSFTPTILFRYGSLQQWPLPMQTISPPRRMVSSRT